MHTHDPILSAEEMVGYSAVSLTSSLVSLFAARLCREFPNPYYIKLE